MTASGTFDGATQDADLQMMAQVTLARLLAIAPQPDVNVTSGTVQVKTHVGKNDQRTVTGQLELAELTRWAGATRLNRFGVVLDFDAGLAGTCLSFAKRRADSGKAIRSGAGLRRMGNLVWADSADGAARSAAAEFQSRYVASVPRGGTR